MSDYQRGLLWTSLGVFCLTPDALLVRLIHADAWTLLFWRGLLMSLSFSIFVVWKRMPLKELSGHGLLAGVFLAGSTTCFVFSLEHTNVANTLVIIATSPLLAGVASWLLLKEAIPRATWLAIAVATSGIALSLADGVEQGNLTGELLALGSAFCMAFHFTTLRAWKSPHGPLSIWAAGFIAALMALPQAKPLSLAPSDWPPTLLLGAVVLPVAFGMMAVGPRYLPAPQVGLLLLGETVLGPLWVWLALGERPGQWTLIGGLVVIGTLTWHALSVGEQKSELVKVA